MDIETMNSIISQLKRGRVSFYNDRLELRLNLIQIGNTFTYEVNYIPKPTFIVVGKGRTVEDAVVDFREEWEKYVNSCFANDRLVYGG